MLCLFILTHPCPLLAQSIPLSTAPVAILKNVLLWCCFPLLLLHVPVERPSPPQPLIYSQLLKPQSRTAPFKPSITTILDKKVWQPGENAPKISFLSVKRPSASVPSSKMDPKWRQIIVNCSPTTSCNR